MPDAAPPAPGPAQLPVVHVITGLNNGGAEGALFRLCTHPDSPPSMVVSLSDAGLYGPRLRALGFRVETLDMPRGRVTLRGLVRLWRILQQVRPEVVQTWMYHADLLGGVIARLASVRRVVWGIRSTRFASRGTAWRVARLCARLSRTVPKAIICCAQSAADEHARMGYAADRMVVISNGFDTATLCPAPEKRQRLRADLGLSPTGPVIGFVARFDPQKDHASLLGALSLLNDEGACPPCILVGPGMVPDNAALARLITEFGLDGLVHPIGPQSDVSAVMNALDLHVMSSQSEGFPNVLAEAMACGCPCVSTDVGAAAEIIGDTGWIVPPKSPEALAGAIRSALAEVGTPAWTTRQTAARARVTDLYGMGRMVSAFRKVWQV